MSTHGHDKTRVQEYFSRQDGIFRAIYDKGAEEYLMSHPSMRSVFYGCNGIVSCIDEGTPHGDIRFAGSGILNEKIREILDRERERGNLTRITSHDECGAARLFVQSKGLDISTADGLGRKFAKYLAEELGVKHVHIGIEDMERPSGLHIARFVYFDGTGRFNPSKLNGGFIPAGFVVSRGYLDAETAVNEAKLAVGIATGVHGFGELITPDKPLIIVPVGHPKESRLSVASLRRELAPIANEYGDRVHIDEGFNAPFP